MARRVADLGYAVLVPNVFYRTGRPPLFDFKPDFKDALTMARFGELAAPLTPDAMDRDGAAYVDFLSAHPWVKGGRMGVVGYCFTGALALRTAAARPDRGRGRVIARRRTRQRHAAEPASRAASRERATLFRSRRERSNHAAGGDRHPERALEHWGGKYESEVYTGAAHSWTALDSPVYNEPQAERAFEKLKQLFAETIAD